MVNVKLLRGIIDSGTLTLFVLLFIGLGITAVLFSPDTRTASGDKERSLHVKVRLAKEYIPALKEHGVARIEYGTKYSSDNYMGLIHFNKPCAESLRFGKKPPVKYGFVELWDDGLSVLFELDLTSPSYKYNGKFNPERCDERTDRNCLYVSGSMVLDEAMKAIKESQESRAKWESVCADVVQIGSAKG